MSRLILGLLDLVYTVILVGILLIYDLPMGVIVLVMGSGVLGFWEGTHWGDTRREN